MTSVSAAAPLVAPVGGPLPRAGAVLVVTARPGQESADLGGLLFAFRRSGAGLALLCLTRGEASPLNSTCGRLEAVRPWELQLAASVLGISSVTVANYPDGALSRYPVAELADRVRRASRWHSADLLLVIDPETGDLDDIAVAAAAGLAGVPVVARTVPGADGAWMIDLGGDAASARAIQKAAAAAHASQSQALPELIGRVDLLGGGEQLRWLVPVPGLPGGDDGVQVPQDRGGDDGLRLGGPQLGLLPAGQVLVAGSVDRVGPPTLPRPPAAARDVPGR